MPITEPKPEITSLLRWLGTPLRSPAQRNTLNESDCEIIELAPGLFLAATVDTISDELQSGLYDDPYTVGWVAAAASLSDLAAAAVEPIGMLWSVTWPPAVTAADQRRLADGFNHCCAGVKVPLLGGDQGQGLALSVTTVGLGKSPTRPLMRSGGQPGDELLLLGHVGLGPMFGIRSLLGKSRDLPEELFRPRPDPRQLLLVRDHVHAAIDLSDGLVGAVFDLIEASGCHAVLSWNPSSVDRRAQQFAAQNRLPQIYNWLGEHGDFVLLVAVPRGTRQILEHAGLKAHCVGGLCAPNDQGPVTMVVGGRLRPIPREWATWSQRLSLAALTREFAPFTEFLQSEGWP